MEFEIREQKDRDLFNETAEKYAEKDLADSSSEIRKYQLEFAVSPILKTIKYGATIIDIGCGIGMAADYLTGYYQKYLGIDYSANLIRIAKKVHQGRPNVEFFTANIKDLQLSDIGDIKADLIIAAGSLHHMTDLDSVIEKIKYFAKPGAYFVALEPQKTNLVIQTMRKIWGLVNHEYSLEQKQFGQEELEQLLIRHGFHQVSSEFQGFISPLFAQFVIKPDLFGRLVGKLSVKIDRIFDRKLPKWLKYLSWNVVARGRFPG